MSHYWHESPSHSGHLALMMPEEGTQNHRTTATLHTSCSSYRADGTETWLQDQLHSGTVFIIRPGNVNVKCRLIIKFVPVTPIKTVRTGMFTGMSRVSSALLFTKNVWELRGPVVEVLKVFDWLLPDALFQLLDSLKSRMSYLLLYDVIKISIRRQI